MSNHFEKLITFTKREERIVFFCNQLSQHVL